ncbi:hypothetical protein KK062_22260 [Fulvivirgaceae bacterium PWU5]|uniref:Organic solvent tolerance-like N-terminal domain-containing protein n=1 Tax=Dawidia cretensis TaxID=2782350 RepID=A0AAP2GVK0_9BACT|nr:OstA-like protein [Dawidia cretensis]MBT1710983.1 hypothetical protein [Dawidia cretensis]
MKPLLLSIILFVMLVPATSSAQTKIKLQQADQYTTKSVKGTAIDRFMGNVIFTHGNTTIHCDSAYFNKKANSLEAFGNVRMQIADDILTGRQLKYDGNTRQADLQPVSGEHRTEDN